MTEMPRVFSSGYIGIESSLFYYEGLRHEIYRKSLVLRAHRKTKLVITTYET
jgi:hypothetical protein